MIYLRIFDMQSIPCDARHVLTISRYYIVDCSVVVSYIQTASYISTELLLVNNNE